MSLQLFDFIQKKSEMKGKNLKVKKSGLKRQLIIQESHEFDYQVTLYRYEASY